MGREEGVDKKIQKIKENEKQNRSFITSPNVISHH